MTNILIIDDDKSILRLLEFTLQRAGYQVTTHSDGEEGLQQAETQQPDLIVVDVMMPKMTGYDFCRRARAMPALEKTPIIMFSARFQPIDKKTALEAGATDYLSKTTSPNDLLKRIAELLPSQPKPTENLAVGLFSMRGGAGLTSLAVNMAVNLALSHKQPTALVDLARLGGHAALMLGVRPTSSVSQALAAAKPEISADSIKTHLIQHSSGVQLLASAPGYDHELLLSDKRLEQLISTIKSSFAFTILDMPHILEPAFASSLQLFDKISLILSPDMPSLQSTAMALQSLARLGIPEQRISLVVNQILPSHALPLETIQKVVKRPILASIPFEPEMVKAVNSGKPLLLNTPKCAGTAAIVKMTTLLLNPAKG
jgi:DNA-binding response OmpR family regulator